MARYSSKAVIIVCFLSLLFLFESFGFVSNVNPIIPQSNASITLAMATTANHASSIWFNHRKGETDIEWQMDLAVDQTASTYKTGGFAVSFSQLNHIDNLMYVTTGGAMSTTANNAFTYVDQTIAVQAISSGTILPFTVKNRYTGYLYQTAGTNTYTHTMPAASACVCRVATMDDAVDYGVASTWESNALAATLYWHLEPTFTIVSNYYNLDNIRIFAYNTISASWIDVDPRNPVLTHPQYKLKIYDSTTNAYLFGDSSTQYFAYQRNITISGNGPLTDIAINIVDQNSVRANFNDYRVDDGTTVLSTPNFQALVGSSKTFNVKNFAGTLTFGSTTLNPVLVGLNNVFISITRMSVKNYADEPIYLYTADTTPSYTLTRYLLQPQSITYLPFTDMVGTYMLYSTNDDVLVTSTAIPADGYITYIPDQYELVYISVVDQNTNFRDPLNENTYNDWGVSYFQYSTTAPIYRFVDDYLFYAERGSSVTVRFISGGLIIDSGSLIVYEGINTCQFDSLVIKFKNQADFYVKLTLASTTPNFSGLTIEPHETLFIYGTDITGTYTIYDANGVNLLSSGAIPATGQLTYTPASMAECIISVKDQNSQYCIIDENLALYAGASRIDSTTFYALTGSSVTINVKDPSGATTYGSTILNPVLFNTNYISVSVKRWEFRNHASEAIYLTTTGTTPLLADYPVMPFTDIYYYCTDETGNYAIEDVYGNSLVISTAIPADEIITYVPDYNVSCIISLFDQRSNYLDWEQFKLYQNGSMLYDHLFIAEIGSSWNISVYDRFNQHITSKISTLNRSANYIDIQLTIHSLKVFNQQEVFNFINITRNPITSEEWTEWLAPNEIIQFRLLAGNYNVKIESNENSSSLNYAYTLAGDDILLLTSQNTLSNAIMNIVNTNVTLGNQITAVNISITNTQTNISNQIVSVNIDLNNINSTLDTQLVNIQADLLNLNSNITTMYAFINNSFINLNSSLGTQFLTINTTLSNINSSIGLLIADVETTVLLVNNSIYTAVVDLETQLLLINNTISGNLSLILELNPELSAIYTNCLFSKNLTWSTNLTAMYSQFDYYTLINNYRNESLEIQFKYGSDIINMQLGAQETINQAIKSLGTQYRVKSINTGEYLSDWESLPIDKKIDLGFYEESVPVTPEQIQLEIKDYLMIALFATVTLAVVMVLYVKAKSQLPNEVNKRRKYGIRQNTFFSPPEDMPELSRLQKKGRNSAILIICIIIILVFILCVVIL